MNIVKAGSETIVIDTTLISLMICTDEHLGKNKLRHCIVHKQRTAQFPSQWTNAADKPVSVVTTPVFEDVRDVMLNLQRQIKDLERDISMYKTQVESYKMTLDALRRNGVID